MSTSPDRPAPLLERPRRLALAFLGATCLAGVAYGQGAGFPLDPTQLPETRGAVKQYTLTPRGDVDGLILTDGTEVKVPPHLTAQMVYAIRPGDAVTIRGLKARVLPLVSATTIRNDATGATVVDEGGPREARDASETLVNGQVASALHGPRGEVNGALLASGLTLRLPPPEASRYERLLQPGAPLSVRGVVRTSLLGSVMDATAIGASPDQLVTLSPRPRPDRGPREAWDARGDRGPRRTATTDVFAPPPPGPAGLTPDAPAPSGLAPAAPRP